MTGNIVALRFFKAFLALAVFCFVCSLSVYPQCYGTLLDGYTLDPKDYSSTVGRENVAVTVRSGTTQLGTVNSGSDGAWSFCDQSNSGNYSISFSFKGHSYDFAWVADRDGVYDLTDFGAVGDGFTDSKRALQSAVYYVAGKNGGKLNVPKGHFVVSEEALLPSGIIIEGNNGFGFSSCRIELTAPGALFKIGENTNGIAIRDILLAAKLVDQPFRPDTSAIQARGSAPKSSVGLSMRDLSILGFATGIDVEGINSNWQFDQIKLDHVSILQCKTCVSVNTQNSDWLVSNSWIAPVKDGIGIDIKLAGFLLIQNTIGAGPTYYTPVPGGEPIPVPIGSSEAAETFINIAGPHGTIKIDNSQCEQFRQSIVVNHEDYGNPIMVASSMFGDSIIFKKNATFVSTGNFYNSDTVETWVSGEARRFVDGTPFSKRMIRDSGACVPINVSNPTEGSAGDVRIFSTGDTFNQLNRYMCANAFQDGTYPQDFIVSGTSAVYGGKTTTVFEKSVGIGAQRPGVGLSGFPTVLEIEAKNEQLPWMILTRTVGQTSTRWGWVVGPDGALYLQQIGSGNRLKIDADGNIVPQYDNTGSIGTDQLRWHSIRAANIMPGDLILTDVRSGEKLYLINEDQENIYFRNFRTGDVLMRLDRNGNLFVKGKVIQGSAEKRSHSASKNMKKSRQR
ncbi:MAG: glycosyl hydrolase family 28-related protein [Pyrinomonadaceae bacterium]